LVFCTHAKKRKYNVPKKAGTYLGFSLDASETNIFPSTDQQLESIFRLSALVRPECSLTLVIPESCGLKCRGEEKVRLTGSGLRPRRTNSGQATWVQPSLTEVVGSGKTFPKIGYVLKLYFESLVQLSTACQMRPVVFLFWHFLFWWPPAARSFMAWPFLLPAEDVTCYPWPWHIATS